MEKFSYAVIGSPIKHSKSPDIYNYLFEKYGIDARYGVFEVGLFELESFLNSTKLLGINLTMPLKEKAAKLIEPVGDAAVIQSVNTIDMKNRKGYTTDGQGLVLSLSFNGICVEGKKAVVMGAGGAAKSVCLALKNAGAEVAVFNRTAERALKLGKLLGIRAGGSELLGACVNECDIFINCTRLGMGGEKELPSGIERLNKNAFIYDIVYEPRETALLRFAKERGQMCCNGLDMLVCQGLLAFEIYTGIKVGKEDRDTLLSML